MYYAAAMSVVTADSARNQSTAAARSRICRTETS